MTRIVIISLIVWSGNSILFGDEPFETVHVPFEEGVVSSFDPTGRNGVGNFDSRSPEVRNLAIDIARRSVLAHYPHASRHPIQTLEVFVRPEGDAVHTYAKVRWSKDCGDADKFYESEVFASLVYTRGIRRIYDISYKDNRLCPWRLFNRRIDLVSKLNEDYERRDPLRMPAALVGNRPDVLAPRTFRWRYHPLQGDHAWHATSADAHIKDSWRSVEPPPPVYPREIAPRLPVEAHYPIEPGFESINEIPQ